MQKWNANLYNQHHSFVANYGRDLINLLEPKANESILDLGSGTGTLTHEISAHVAQIIGLDSSSEMVSEAQKNYPNIKFICGDAHNFKLENPVDAVFSNAALHWMLKPEEVIHSVYKALKPGGRFILEMGGIGNVAEILSAIITAAHEFGFEGVDAINYYPSISEYTTLLERAGFRVKVALLFDRPTKLDSKDGLKNWVKMFRKNILSKIDTKDHENFLTRVEDIAKPTRLQNGIWYADYVRLRVVAYKI